MREKAPEYSFGRAAAGEPAEDIALMIWLAGAAGIDSELSWENAIALLPEYERRMRAWAASNPKEALRFLKLYRDSIKRWS